MHVMRSLRNPSFSLLWSGQTISRLGDSFYTVALAWWVLEKTGSAAVMGLVLVCSSVPMILFLLFGGVAVDRFSRLHLMLASDVFRALIVIAIAVLAFAQRLEIWQVLIASGLFGFVDAFFFPAYIAIVPDIVAGEDLTSANSLRSLSSEFTLMIGPALAGLIIASGGTALAFALNAISFILSGICLLMVPQKRAFSQKLAVEASALQDLREGLGTVMRSPWLWITISIAGLSNLTLAGPMETALPLLVKQRFGANAQMYGLLMGISAIGSVLSAILIGRRKRLRHRGYLLYGAWIVASLMIFLMGLPLPFVGLSLIFCIVQA